MASSTIGFEQRKLQHGFTPSASQPDTASLYDKEAHLARGSSWDTAIDIPSDVESDTEDEDDASQLDSSPSDATRISTPDYLDLTIIEQDATESEAAVIGVDIVSAVSSTQAETATTWPNEPKVSHFADAEPSQQSCEMNHLPSGNASACQDINFEIPPVDPGSQSYPVAADGEQLQSPASQQSNMMIDAVFDHDTCHNSQDHQGSPSVGAHSPRTASPVEVVQASRQENEIAAGCSRDDAIRDHRLPSLAIPSDKPCQGPALDDTSSAPIHAESEAMEVGSGSEAEVSPTSPSLRRSRHKSLQMRKTMQSKNVDAGSEVSGSRSRLDGEESSPSFPNDDNSGSEDNNSEDIHQGRKRRKASKSSSCSVHSTAACFRGSRKRQSATSASSDASAFLARFEEWPLENVLLKRITEGSKTTFQFQFELSAFSCQPHTNESVSHPKKRRRLARNLRSVAKSSGEAWTSKNNHISSTPDTIFVAGDGGRDDSDDNDLGTKSNFEDDSYSDSEPGTTRSSQRRKAQRRRWKPEDNEQLRRLKHEQKKGRKLLDSEIAAILGRTESAVKQHWDLMLLKDTNT